MAKPDTALAPVTGSAPSAEETKSWWCQAHGAYSANNPCPCMKSWLETGLTPQPNTKLSGPDQGGAT